MLAGYTGAQEPSTEGPAPCPGADTVEATAVLFLEAVGTWPSGLGASVGLFLKDRQGLRCTSVRGHPPGPCN